MSKNKELASLMHKIFSGDTDNICQLLRDVGLNPEIHLKGMNLNQTEFIKQDLSFFDLRYVDLQSSNLEGSDLTGADLSGANLRNAILRDTNLIGANFSNVDFSGAVLEGAYIDNILIDEKYAETLLIEGAQYKYQERPNLEMKSRNSISDTRLLIVDDHKLVREGISNACHKRGYQVAGEAENGKHCIEVYEEVKPCIILMDLSMPFYGGLEATRELVEKYPNVVIIALTAHNSRQAAKKMLEVGARGFISKSDSADEVFNGINCVANGQVFLSNSVKPSQDEYSDIISEPKDLTKRQIQILSLLFEGYSTKYIGEKIGLSQRTIQCHIHLLCNNFQVENRAELLRKVRELDVFP